MKKRTKRRHPIERIYAIVGKRIRSYRRQMLGGMSQTELAKACGLSRGTIVSPEYFKQFMDIVGEKNVRWLVRVSRTSDNFIRGQLFISPEGSQSLDAYIKAAEDRGGHY